jgi:hypothetical protein
MRDCVNYSPCTLKFDVIVEASLIMKQHDEGFEREMKGIVLLRKRDGAGTFDGPWAPSPPSRSINRLP